MSDWDEVPAEVADTEIILELRDGDGDWKWPRTQYVYRTIEGPLAVRVRERLGASEDEPVEIYERIEVGGYSEYTSDVDSFFEIRCFGEEIEFECTDVWSPLMGLLAWLDGAPAPGAPGVAGAPGVDGADGLEGAGHEGGRG